MATQAQKDRIKQLRSQGWTQKRIAEDPLVNMSPQNVSVILMEFSKDDVSTSHIKIIHATGFQPKDTVVSFEPTEFENLRTNNELYATGQDLYELRGDIIHHTTLPPEINTEIYPDIADIISITRHFTYLPNRQELVEKIKAYSPSSGDFRRNVGYYFLSRDGIRSSMIELQEKDRSERTEEDNAFEQNMQNSSLLIQSEIEPLLPKIEKQYLEEQIMDFLPGMPPIEEKAKLIRYVAENRLTEKGVRALSQSFRNARSDGRGATEEGRNYIDEIFNRAFSSIGISEENIDWALKFGTFDLPLIEAMKSNDAPTIDLMKRMDAEGFSSWSDYQNYLDDFINSTTPIKVDLFDNLSSEKSKYNLKIIDAIERDDLDAALSNAWTRFEKYAMGLFKEKYQRQPRNHAGGYRVKRLEGVLPDPENVTMGELIDAVLPMISKENRSQIISEARDLRNADQHHGETEYILSHHHVKVVLEVTEKIILTIQTLE